MPIPVRRRRSLRALWTCLGALAIFALVLTWRG